MKVVINNHIKENCLEQRSATFCYKRARISSRKYERASFAHAEIRGIASDYASINREQCSFFGSL